MNNLSTSDLEKAVKKLTAPIITIFCSFTRSWSVERWLQNLSSLDYEPKLINLAFIVDCDDPRIASRLAYVEKNYRSFVIEINRKWQPNEVRPIERRKRIAEVKRQSKYLVMEAKADYVFSLEDDTVWPNLKLERLLAPLEADLDSNLGTVEGVQVGRWGKKMVGAWKFDNIENPTELISQMPTNGYQEIDSGGFYGYVTPYQLYLDTPYAYMGEVWGPDVNAGLWLRRQGYVNLIDWETKFGHNGGDGIIWPDTDVIQYKFIKRGETWLPVIP